MSFILSPILALLAKHPLFPAGIMYAREEL
jgi:hypothetical protein